MKEKSNNKTGFKIGNTYGKGRPKGATTRAVLLKDYATEEDHGIIMKNIIDLAKGGDFGAMTLYVSKVCGIPKLPSSVILDFAKRINTIADMNEIMTEVTYGGMIGEIHLDDVAEIQKISINKGASIQQCNADELKLFKEHLAIHPHNK